MPIISPPEFYAPWPLFGKKMSFQWGNIRKDTETLKVLSRSLAFDEHVSKYIDSAVAGYEQGEDGFHNKFRTFFDKVTGNWLLQYNTGTEALPVWVNYIKVDSVGVVTFAGSFYTATLDVRAGGDTGDVPPVVYNVRHLIFHSTDFYISKNSLSQPVVNMRKGAGLGDITNAVNLAAEGVFASKATDTLQFKGIAGGTGISVGATGTTITVTNTGPTLAEVGPGFYGIGVIQSDNTKGYSGINTISFEASSFYLKRSTTDRDKVQVNFRVTAGGGAGTITGGTALGGTEPVFAGTVAPNLTFKGLTAGTGISLGSDANSITVTNTGPTLAQIGPGFYGITVGQSNNVNVHKAINVVKFNTSHFYVHQNATNTDEVVVSLRQSVTELLDELAALPETIDSRIGPAFYGITAMQSDGKHAYKNLNVLSFEVTNFYLTRNTTDPDKVQINIRPSAAVGGGGTITGGASLGGSEPIFASNAAPTINFKGLSAGTGISLSSDANAVTVTNTGPTLSQIGPGFYGISVLASDGSLGFSGIKVISFGIEDFYLHSNPTDPDKVLVNHRHKLADEITAVVSLGGDQAVLASGIPPAITFKGLTAGTGISLSSNAAAITITNTGSAGGGGFYGITAVQSDGKHGYKNLNVLSFEAANFYLTRNATDPDKVQINFRPAAVTNTGLTLSQIGPGFYGIGVIQSNNSKGYSGINTLSFEVGSFYLKRSATDRDKVQINLRPTAGGGAGTITGGTSLGGSEAVFAGTVAPNLTFKGLTAGVGVSLSSDGNAITISSSGSTGVNGGASADFAASKEWVLNHNLNTNNITWSIYDNRGQAFIPQRVDTSNPNTAYFYMSPATAGKAVVLVSGAPDAGPGFYGISVIQSNNSKGYSGIKTISFEVANFYIKRSAADTDKIQIGLRPPAGGGTITGGASLGGTQAIYGGTTPPTINFKGLTAGAGITLTPSANDITIASTATGGGGRNTFYVTNTINFQFDYPVKQSYFLDSYSFEAYSVEQVNVITTSGQASVGFYIRSTALAGDSRRPGISIQGLDPLNITRATASRSAVTASATGNNAVPLGAELIMSVFYLSQNPKGIRGSMRIRTVHGA